MIDIEYICFINESGYGQAAYDLIKSLWQTNNYNIKLNCLNGKITQNFLSNNSFNLFSKFMTNSLQRNPLQIYHCIPTMYNRFPRKDKAIGFATYETYEPPNNWINILNQMDAVVCPSQFNYKIFAHAGVKRPLFYIPHGFDKDLFNKNVSRLQKFDKFTFLYAGTWKKRKGYDLLIEAFLREFDAEERVQLIIKTDKSQVALQDIAKIKHTLGLKKEYPQISLERRIFDDEHLPAFYKSADCFVMATLGEGFGLPAMQCMAVGTPVIITNFSGCQDYANDETCTLINPDGFMLHANMDNIVQFNNRKWPRLTIHSIQQAMRNVKNNYEAAVHKADKAYDFVHQNFNYNVVSKHFTRLMECVYGAC